MTPLAGLKVVEHRPGGGATVTHPDGQEEHFASLHYAAKCLGVSWDEIADHMQRMTGVRPRYSYGGGR